MIRLLALSAVLLTFSYAASWSFSQNQGNARKNGQSSTAQSGQAVSVSPTVEPADPEMVNQPPLPQAGISVFFPDRAEHFK